jgi:peptidoglycan/LPS O-acetylase OafA/YrhL
VGDAWRIMDRDLRERGEVGMDRWFYADTWRRRQEILRQAPKLLAQKLWVFFGPATRDPAYWPYRLLWPFAVLGLWIGRPRDRLAFGLAAAVVLSQIALALATVPWGRYRYPIEPFLWPLAAAAGVMMWQRGWAGRALGLSILALNAAVALLVQR